MKRRAIAIAALSGVLIAAQPASAESVEVQFEDLDLTTPQGRKELDRRIDRAAEQVCGARETTVGTRLRSSETIECIRQARRQTRASMAKLIETRKAGG